MPQRDIKFKGWHVPTSKMIDLQAITPLALSGNIPGLFLPNNPDTILLQFTGMLDSTDKEVYEGDIVRYTYANGETEIFRVYWDGQGMRFKLMDANGDNWSFSARNKMEVIGDIYQTPQLLK